MNARRKGLPSGCACSEIVTDPDRLDQAIKPRAGNGLIEADLEKESTQESESIEVSKVDLETGKETNENAASDEENSKYELLQMAAFSGFALAVHNFPEGLATFVAACEDLSFGGAMAVAIGIHNIPEGLAVAIPILRATGSKWKAFFWAFLSGVSEPVGAALGWLILMDVMGPITYAILFGVIGGVMTHIAIRKLLPTALKYDPEDIYSTYSFFLGMVIMALSLVAFQL